MQPSASLELERYEINIPSDPLESTGQSGLEWMAECLRGARGLSAARGEKKIDDVFWLELLTDRLPCFASLMDLGLMMGKTRWRPMEVGGGVEEFGC